MRSFLPLLPFRGPVLPFWLLAAFLVLLFLAGGGSRSDIASLVFIRPLAALLFVIGIAGLDEAQRTRHGPILALTFAVMALVALHLLPLPPALWHLLPQRDMVRDIDVVAELGAVWRPVSLVPWRTANALFALTVPAAALLLAIHLPGGLQRQLVRIVLAAALLSAALGILQKVGPADGPLYLYEVTNQGSAVGLFANRNHHAVFLAACLPLLAFELSFAARSREAMLVRLWLGLGIGILFVAVMVATASRAGILLGALALLTVPLLYQPPRIAGGRHSGERAVPFRRRLIWLLPALVLAMVAVAASGGLLERIDAGDRTDELRLLIWGPILTAAWNHFPAGSGFGSFVEAYQMIEPVRLLGDRYINHAHNDLLEVVMTGGLPALLLLGAAVWAWGRQALWLWRQPMTGPGVHLARVGAVVTLLFALASLADYPLRTPSLCAFFIVAALWMTQGETVRSRQSSGPESAGGAQPV